MDLTVDPFEGIDPQRVPDAVLVHYIEEYFPEYVDTEIEIRGVNYNWLDVALAVISLESGKNAVQMSNVQNESGNYEASFGLWSLLWQYDNQDLVHAEWVVDDMISQGVVTPAEKASLVKPLQQMTEDESNLVMKHIANIETQFRFAKSQYEKRKSEGPFASWYAFYNPNTDTYDIIEGQFSTIQDAITSVKRVKDLGEREKEQRVVDFHNNYIYPGMTAPTPSLAAQAVPDAPITQPGQLGGALSEGGTPSIDQQWNAIYGLLLGDINNPVVSVGKGRGTIVEKWTGQYFGGDLSAWDPDTGEILKWDKFTGEQAINSQYVQFIKSGQLDWKTFATPSVEAGVIDMLFTMFSDAANRKNGSGGDVIADAYLYSLRESIFKMIEAYPTGSSITSVANDIARQLTSWGGWTEGTVRTWGDTSARFDENYLTSRAQEKIATTLLDSNPRFADSIVREYKDAQLNSDVVIDYETFIDERLKDSTRYRFLYRNKPDAMSEGEYLNYYTGAAAQTLSPGAPGYQDIVAAGMGAGSAGRDVAVSAEFTEESQYGDMFLGGVESMATELNSVLT